MHGTDGISDVKITVMYAPGSKESTLSTGDQFIHLVKKVQRQNFRDEFCNRVHQAYWSEVPDFIRVFFIWI